MNTKIINTKIFTKNTKFLQREIFKKDKEEILKKDKEEKERLKKEKEILKKDKEERLKKEKEEKERLKKEKEILKKEEKEILKKDKEEILKKDKEEKEMLKKEEELLKKEELYDPHRKAKKEVINIRNLHYHIKNDTLSGQKIKESFMKSNPHIPLFDYTIVEGATRNKHYDLVLQWCVNNDKKNVECKFSEQNKKINCTKPPWSNAVQFYNGTGKNFSVGNIYARKFYDTIIDEIINNYQIKIPKPTYEEWITDVFRSGKPITPFVCELRKKGYKSEYLSQIRKKFNKSFILNTYELEILKNEVFKSANKVLEEKDYWLQINGDINDSNNFEIRWSGKIKIKEILEVRQMINKDGCDINFEFICDEDNTFYAKLRWGYGQCVSNLRLDLK